jgi:hypothetical protein
MQGEALSLHVISTNVLALILQLTNAPPAYAEVLDFLLNRPTPEAIAAFAVFEILHGDGPEDRCGNTATRPRTSMA